MNQKIDNIANQVMEEFHDVFMDSSSIIPDEFFERFAQLIAQECADLCLKHAEFEGPFGVMEMRKGQNFYTIIRNHFGIAKGETE